MLRVSCLKSRLVLTLISLAACISVLAGCTLASEPIPAGPIQSGPLPSQQPETPVSLPNTANGRLIFLERCSSCHGLRGAGDGTLAEQIIQQGGQLPDLSDPVLARARSPQAWYQIITNGTVSAGGLMPPWRQALTDAERWDVTYYLYSLSIPPETLDEGQAVYVSQCAACHGENGDQEGLNDPAAMSALSLQDIYDRYITDGGDGVHAFGDQLSEDQRWAVAAYVLTFSYSDSPTEPAQAEAPAVPPEEAEAGPAVTSEAGIVQGVVTNATAGASVPAGLEVKLSGLRLDENGDVVEFITTSKPIAADGSFRFTDLPMDNPDSAYVVSVVYNGVEFANGVRVDPAVPSVDLPITIYETTTDPSVVTVEALHFVIREHPDALLVMQLYVFSNSSDRVFVSPDPVSGGRRGGVAIALPPDAYGVQFEEGEMGGRFIAAGDLIYDMQQVTPGSRSHTIVLSYFLPADGAREISLPLLYRTSQITVLAPEGRQISSGQLNPAGTEVISGAAYNKYLGQNLVPGSTLSFTVRPAFSARTTLQIVLGAALGVVVIGGVILLIVQRRRWSEAEPAEGLQPEVEALIRQIAELDEAFEAGRLNRFEYEAQRAALKAALAEKMEE